MAATALPPSPVRERSLSGSGLPGLWGMLDERVAADPSLEGTVIQTVGAKGYDGFLLVRRADA